MKTLYRLLALLLLASISHQLNAAPTKDIGQSAIQISVAYFQPAAIAILDAPDLQTADLSPDIGYKQKMRRMSSGMTKTVATPRTTMQPGRPAITTMPASTKI